MPILPTTPQAWTQPRPGLFVMSYVAGDDLLPEKQHALVAAIGEAAATGQTVIVFDVGPGVRTVNAHVPGYWMEVTARTELRLAGLAVVTNAIAVTAAARGFKVVSIFRTVKLAVEIFDTQPAAVAWANRVLDGSAAQGAARA